MPTLKYGERTLTLAFPPEYSVETLRINVPAPAASPEGLVAESLEHCAGHLALFQPGEKVVIVTSDITRYTAGQVYLPLLVERLNLVGIPDADITILIALGIHRR